MPEGLVMKSTGSWYVVRTGDGRTISCRLRGRLRLAGAETTNPVAVGDRVLYEANGGEGVITDILPRDNYIIRRATKLSSRSHVLAANVDMALLVATAARPRTSEGFIDRFLLTAEAYHIPASVLINKKDLCAGRAGEKMQSWVKMYTAIGYPCRSISALDDRDAQSVKAALHNRVVLLAGHSGVGKSTLINAMDPSLDLRVKEISRVHDKGMHATTFAEMYAVEGGGYIIDTPGIKEMGIVDIPKAEVSHYFIEMRRLLPGCRFNNCLHRNEPGCAVLKALERGEVYESRYRSYLGILEE